MSVTYNPYVVTSTSGIYIGTTFYPIGSTLTLPDSGARYYLLNGQIASASSGYTPATADPVNPAPVTETNTTIDLSINGIDQAVTIANLINLFPRLQPAKGDKGDPGVQGNTGPTGPIGPSVTINGKNGQSITLTAADIGLGNVANLAPKDLPVSNATSVAIQAAINSLLVGQSGSTSVDLSTLSAIVAQKASQSDFITHVQNQNNPHVVTKAQVGLGNVANLDPTSMPVSTAQAQADAAVQNAAASDATTKMNAAQASAIAAAATDATTKANAAQASAISAASSDATTKANAAQAAAISAVVDGADAAHGTLAKVGALIDTNTANIAANTSAIATKANASDLTNLSQSTLTALGGKLDTSGDGSGLSVTLPGQSAQALPSLIAGRLARQSTALTIAVPAQASTPQAGIDACGALAIDRGVTATVQIAAGTYTSSATLDFSHPYGRRISVLGAAPVSLTLTGIGSVTGSAGAWSVPLTVSAANGAQVGQVVKITAATGSNWQTIAGAWLITAVSGNTITLAVTIRVSTFPTVTITGGTASLLTTIIKVTGAHGLMGGDTGLIDNVALIGNNASGTVGVITAPLGSVASTSTISINFGANVAILNFGDGGVYAQASGSIHFIPGAAITGSTVYGLHAQTSGSIFANGCVVAGCGSHNVIAQYSGSIYFQGGLTIGAGGCGALAQLNGSVLSKAGTAMFNASCGYGGWYGGALQAESATASNNTGHGVWTQERGLVYFTSGTATANGANGILSTYGALTVAQSATLSGNTANAISTDYAGEVDATSAVFGSSNVYADHASRIFMIGYSGTVGFTPAANTLGAKQQYIFTN